MRRTVLALALLLVTALPRASFASPWTLPRGTLVVAGTYNFQTARQEFLDASPARNFPLEGQYTGSSWALDVPAGITDHLELELYLPLRLVSYQSDPVLLIPRPAMSNE